MTGLRRGLTFVLAALALGTAAGAQEAAAPMAHHGQAMPMSPTIEQTPAAQAYMDAMTTMHEAMMMDATGDADVDFARGMIPHHEGAIAMARIELRYGKDPALRELAERIVASQEAEVKMMQDWLAAHGH